MDESKINSNSNNGQEEETALERERRKRVYKCSKCGIVKSKHQCLFPETCTKRKKSDKCNSGGERELKRQRISSPDSGDEAPIGTSTFTSEWCDTMADLVKKQQREIKMLQEQVDHQAAERKATALKSGGVSAEEKQWRGWFATLVQSLGIPATDVLKQLLSTGSVVEPQNFNWAEFATTAPQAVATAVSEVIALASKRKAVTLQCKICGSNGTDFALLLPCSHIACLTCSKTLEKCHICSEPCLDRKFLLNK